MNDLLALDLIRVSKSHQTAIHQAVYQLSDSRAFSALLEILTDIEYVSRGELSGFERAALNAAFKDGYTRAIKELMELAQIGRAVAGGAVGNPTKADYGALDALLANKEISQEEYDKLKNEDY